MKAVVIGKYRSIDDIYVGDLDKPSPKNGEVLVRVMAASVNSGDERIRSLNFTGLPIPKWLIEPIMKLVIGVHKPRKTLGVALAGVIEEIGDGVENLKIGDKVYAMTGARFGAFAEYATLKADHCVASMPQKANYEQAAAIPFGATTAMHFLRSANIENAKKVLIYGSTGAVGSAAVQIATYYGAEVTAFCGSDGAKLSKKLGAKRVFDYKKQKLSEISATYDVVFNAVGYISKSDCESVLGKEGKYISVMGFDTAKELASDLQFIAKLYDEGKFVEAIDSTYTLEEVQEAFKRVGTGHKKGSVVLVVQ